MIVTIGEGDRYQIATPNLRGTFVAGPREPDGDVLLRNVADNEVISLKPIDFAILQGNGGAICVERDGEPIKSLSAWQLRSITKPSGPKVTLAELKKWEKANKQYKRAATLYFYIVRLDQYPVAGNRTDTFLEGFRRGLADEAINQRGFEWVPSPSSLRRAAQIGTPGRRALAALFRKINFQIKRNRWPIWVYELGQRMVAEYWRKSEWGLLDAFRWFDAEFFAIKKPAEEHNGKPFEPPSEGTLANWIHAATSHATVASKWGLREANRRLQGTFASISADAPLQYIVLDQTVADIWVVILNDDGEVIAVKRPWIVYAMDLFSRLVLGFVMTFEPPSVVTLMACLKQTIQPKVEFYERFGDCKGATDGYGMGYYLVLDNGMENVGVTMQMAGEAVGFQVIWAPVKTPEFKPWIERLIGTLNKVLHSLPGGIPYKPEELKKLGLDPRKHAALTLDQARALVEHRIITGYHLEVHDGIGMAPARKWRSGIQQFGRNMVDDANMMNLLGGKFQKGTLTRSGISHRGHTFHSQDITSMLIDDMAPLQKKGRGKAAFGQSAVISVWFWDNDLDCSSIAVVNEATNEIVIEPNEDEVLLAIPVSYAFVAEAQAREKKLDEKFLSRDERAAFYADFLNELQAMLAHQNHRQGKSTVRLIEGGRNLQLLPGSKYRERQEESSISGMEGVNIKSTIPFSERTSKIVPARGRKPGGSKKGSKNARSDVSTSERPIVTSRSLVVPEIVAEVENEAELDALEKRLKAQMLR